MNSIDPESFAAQDPQQFEVRELVSAAIVRMSWIGLVVNIATDATGPPTRSPCPAPHNSWAPQDSMLGIIPTSIEPREAARHTSTAGRTAAQTVAQLQPVDERLAFR